MRRIKFGRALREFNQQKFFEAHESLEEIWRDASGREKAFLQALIQAAVALHHFTQGNLVGAGSLLAKSVRTLASYPDDFCWIKVATLRHELVHWQKALNGGQPPPPLPKIVISQRQTFGPAKGL